MSRWEPNRAAIHATSRNVAFPLVNRYSNEVLAGGQRLSRLGSHKHGSGKTVAKPRLSATGKRVWAPTGPDVIAVNVVFTADHASTVALGSKAHKIPKSGHAKPLLKFKWPRGEASPRLRRRMTRTGFFLFTRVRHPGRKRPVRFLQTPLATYGRKYNFKVTTASANRSYLP